MRLNRYNYNFILQLSRYNLKCSSDLMGCNTRKQLDRAIVEENNGFPALLLSLMKSVDSEDSCVGLS